MGRARSNKSGANALVVESEPKAINTDTQDDQAWQALYELANLAEGQTVLIHAAAGGVGHIAIQLAKLRGAKVIGSTSKHIDFIKEIGADETFD